MSGTIELQTKSLLLRRYRTEDAQVLHEKFGADEEMRRYSGWNPYATEEQAAATVAEFIEQYEDPHFYGWAAEHEGQFAGTIGAYDYDPAGSSIEIGCSVAREFWGRGFAGEMIRSVTEYLLEHEGIGRVTAWCAADNVGSVKAMQKAGMTLVGRQEGALQVGGKAYDKLDFEVRSTEVG